MDVTIKCFVCHVKTDDWRNDLHGLKSQHSNTFVTDFIKKILGDYNSKRNIDDESNCICVDCLNRFEEYDWTCTMAKHYEKELYDLLVKTDALCFSEIRQTEPIGPNPPIVRSFVDPLTGYVEQTYQVDDTDGDDGVVKMLVEPLLIPKDKLSDDEDIAVESGAIENLEDDPDFNCKLEADSNHDSNHDFSDDDDYVPQKRIVKVKKPKTNITKVEDPNAPAPKKRGRKPKNRDVQEGSEEVTKPRKKREKRTYECKNCDQVFNKCIEFVVSIFFFFTFF